MLERSDFAQVGERVLVWRSQNHEVVRGVMPFLREKRVSHCERKSGVSGLRGLISCRKVLPCYKVELAVWVYLSVCHVQHHSTGFRVVKDISRKNRENVGAHVDSDANSALPSFPVLLDDNH